MFDVIVIGGGPGGYRAAYLLGRKNFKVALVEEENIGGVCLLRAIFILRERYKRPTAL